jgi:cytochrome c2
MPWARLRPASRPRALSPTKQVAAGWAIALVTGLFLLADRAIADMNKESITFAREGQTIASLDPAQMQMKTSPQSVRVFEPYEKDEADFLAFPLAEVLDAVYSPSWRTEDELLLTCRDGYRPSVPAARVLAHSAWLAFSRQDTGSFSILKPESGQEKRVDLGPFYLVWENLHDAVIRQEGDYGWPYQLVGIDLVSTRQQFRAMAPPADASAQVSLGFQAFRIHCSRCHRLNGEGGEIGPELNPVSGKTRYYDRDWLGAWIRDPASMRPGTRMPPLNIDLPDRERSVQAIIAYLYAISGEAAERKEH